jgi:hypothetical protein
MGNNINFSNIKFQFTILNYYDVIPYLRINIFYDFILIKII